MASARAVMARHGGAKTVKVRSPWFPRRGRQAFRRLGIECHRDVLV